MRQAIEACNVRTTDRFGARFPFLMITAMAAVLAGGLTGGPWHIAAADELPRECEPHWDGAIGQPGMNHNVRALTGFDDGSGSGPALYAAGWFTTAGGVAVNRIARWDGESWSPLGSGVSGGNCCPEVFALTVFDDGSGPALYVGGSFTMAGGVEVNRIARWDGSSWSALDSGISDGQPTRVYALTAFDDGSGPALYVGGRFTTAGGIEANHIARWAGSSWSPLGEGMNNDIRTLTVFDDGSGGGPALYAGGNFTTAGGVEANRIARWDGLSWSPLGEGMDARVRALKVFDDGSGSGAALYTGGEFTTAGGVSANHIAKWDGSSWSPVGNGLSSTIHDLMTYDDGSGAGEELYAGGIFLSWPIRAIAKWNGSSWSPLGSGIQGNANSVYSMTVYDDGTGAGPALYVGGNFGTAGGIPATRIAKWQGCPSASPTPVHFDIRPGGCPNPINPNANGVLPGAVLGDAEFDVELIDAATLLLSRSDGVGGLVAPLTGPPGPGVKIEDVAAPGSNGPCDCSALAPDGIADLSLKFSIPELVAVLELDTLDAGETVELQIAGQLFDGTPFLGTDCVTLVGNGNQPTGAIGTSSGDVPPCSSPDLNCDGVVDGLDLLILLSQWGECADPHDCPADLNGDGTVDGADLLIQLSNWG